MNWFVARTETNMERKSVIHSKRFGIETFLPEILQIAKVRKQVVVRRTLMFPCYVFLRLENMTQWYRASRDGYVFSYLLGYDARVDAVSPVADAIVDEIKSRMVNGVVPATALVSPFHVGQKIRVARGQYADLAGLVTDTSIGRVTALLSLFNRSLSVPLDDSLVIAA